ncbi:YbaB/EbfC family nucleoid-associated protein [Amycolatopsis panacis]|uniref:YbaB/EbfC family DNA-binding protein n=1 Tax=Amycolatopsis panacis TaxID=2340917 RepID=A0A419I9A7_9PSEU|nr:YbaB/EbfC family nucleoid-associated protein [Amycolatopsis panacis]RJQ88853.1 hypothetical protein D5S19_05840 [Amycolatopsis panacis]
MTTAGDDHGHLEVTPHVLTSPDGLVRATVSGVGTLGRLEFTPDAFERTTPAQLAATVQTLVQQLTGIPDRPESGGYPMPAPRPTPRRVRPRGAVPQNRRRGS